MCKINKRDALNNSTKTEWYGDEISIKKSQSLKESYIYFLKKAGVKWFEFDTSDYGKEEQIVALLERLEIEK